MSDPFREQQEREALRQQIEQTFANQPAMRDALRRNEDALRLELDRLPFGTSPDVAIDRLGTHDWFRDAGGSGHGFGEPAEAIRSSDFAGSNGRAECEPSPRPAVREPAPSPFDPRWDKCFRGYVTQLDPEIEFWTLDWLLQLGGNDLAQWLPGWEIERGIGPHVEPNGRYLVAFKDRCDAFGAGRVTLYLSAFDWGVRFDPRIGRFHATQIDAYFVDSARVWNDVAAEQDVAAALDLLHCSYTAAYAGPPKPFWHRVHGHWACGQALFPCPQWVG